MFLGKLIAERMTRSCAEQRQLAGVVAAAAAVAVELAAAALSFAAVLIQEDKGTSQLPWL